MIREVQYLRAVAALMVVVFHTVPQLKRMGYTGGEFDILAHGVDIFFVISGFIMTLISFRKPQTTAKFLWSRIVRIVPLYWVLTAFMVVVGCTIPSVLQSSVVTFPHTLGSFFFVPMRNPANIHPFPLLQVGWTLNYEMYFYLLFSFFVGFRSVLRYWAAILAIALATAAFAVAPSSIQTVFFSDPIVFEFCFGIVLGIAFCTHREWFTARHANAVGYGLIGVGLLVMAGLSILFPRGERLFCYGAPSIIIVVGGLVASTSKKPLISTLAERMGDASYSLYLSQFIMMSAFGQISRMIFGTSIGLFGELAFAVYSTVGCVIVAFLLYDYVEVPLRRFFHSLHVPCRQPI